MTNKKVDSEFKGDWQKFDQRCRLSSFDDIMTYKRDPKLYIVGNGFIKRGEMNALVARTDSGKSVMVEQIAVSVACGLPILTKLKVHGPHKVLLWQSENDDDVMNTHISAITDYLQAPKKLLKKNFMTRHVFGLYGEDFARYLQVDVEKYRPDLVIVDHYQSFVCGNMNDADTFRDWYDPMLHLMEHYNMAVLMVCHTPKIREGKNEPHYEGMYQAAGTASLANSVRTGWSIVKEHSQRGRFKIQFEKKVASTGLRDEDGGIVHSIYAEHSKNPDKPYWVYSENQVTSIKVNVVDVLVAFVRNNPTVDKRTAVQMAKEGRIPIKRSTVFKYWDTAKKILQQEDDGQ